MKFLCISAATDEAQQQSRRSKLRGWYNSIRRGLVRSREPRVTISEPIPIDIETLKQSDLIHLNGVIEVKPSDHDDNQTDTTKVNNVERSADNATKEDSTDHVDGPTESTNDNTNSSHDQPVATTTIVSAPTSASPSPAPVTETTDQIAGYDWFWGSISRKEAESLLRGKKDGSFLVRASSDKRFLYSLSFRSNGKTMHTRIEHSNGLYFFFSNEASSSRGSDGTPTLGGLISVAMNQNSADSIFFYSRGQRSESSSLHTVSLTTPLSRYRYLLEHPYEHSDNKALQYLCKFVIHHCPGARSKLDAQLHALPAEISAFTQSAAYFPRGHATS